MFMPVNISSAYRQLQPTEKAYVDGYVRMLESEASARHERISSTIARPIPIDTYAASRGLLDRALVRAAIAERVAEIAAATELTVDRIVREYCSIAFSSLAHYGTFTPDGIRFDFTGSTPEQLSAIQFFQVEETVNASGAMKKKTTIKLHDKGAALNQVAAYTGMLSADNPYWRAESAKVIDATPLPANVTDEEAADAYARIAHASG